MSFSRRRGDRHNRGRVPQGAAAPGPPPEPTGTLQAAAGSSSTSFVGSVGVRGELAAAAGASTTDFAGTVASSATPQTIMGANCTHRWKSDTGITVLTGVSAWVDMVASVVFLQGTGANQPTYNAAGGPNSKPSLRFDGANDSLAATLIRSAPGTLNKVIWMVFRHVTWTSNDPLCNDAGGAFVIRQRTATPNIDQFNTTDVNNNGGAALNTWARMKAHFTNSVADLTRIIANQVSGANAGNTAGTAPLLGRNNGSTAFADWELAEICFFDAIPSGAQDTALDAYCTAEYGSGLV